MFQFDRLGVVLVTPNRRTFPRADHPRKGVQQLVREVLGSYGLHYFLLNFFGVCWFSMFYSASGL
jgi:hypothetical protein